MSYRIDVDEPVAAELKRLVREEADAALSHIATDSGAGRDEAVHEARKSVKKIRAILRLVRPRAPKLYARENPRMRQIGRELSELRDSAAMIETIDELVGAAGMKSIRDGLAKTRVPARVEDVLLDTSASLNKLKKRIEKWQLRGLGSDALKPGVESAYRKGRRLLRLALKHPDPAIWHEWRKRVKDHWYHVRLLESGSVRERDLNKLESALGMDHNLVILTDIIRAEPGRFGGPRSVAAAIKLIGERDRKLRQQSLALGSKLYKTPHYGPN